jgi:dipeptidyl aminopeptidase/acylaminoacyl peptidase
MGAFASAWFAKRHPEAVVGCVFIAPGFVFLERRWNLLTDEERAEWERTGRRRVTSDWVDAEVGYGLVKDRHEYTPAKLADGWAAPALLFHGCLDDVVPDTDSLDFLRRVAYPDVELRLFKDGDHRLTAHKDAIASGVGEFFARRNQV